MKINFGKLGYAKVIKPAKMFEEAIRKKIMFEKEALDAIVKKQLVTVPEDHTIAVVAVANQDGVKLVTAVKIKEDWEIQAYAMAAKNHKIEYGASVQWSK